GDAADAEQVGVLQRRRLVEEADAVVHDPDVGVADLEDLIAGAGEDAHEDGHLVRHEQGGEGHAEDEGEVLVTIAHEHPQRDPVHGTSPQGAFTSHPCKPTTFLSPFIIPTGWYDVNGSSLVSATSRETRSSP